MAVNCDCKHYYTCPSMHEQDYIRLQVKFSKACLDSGFDYLDNNDLRDFVTRYHNHKVDVITNIYVKNLAKLPDTRLIGLAYYSKHKESFQSVHTALA